MSPARRHCTNVSLLHATFNFNWQPGYELAEPIKVSKGTRMIVTAHHDNSASNRLNPDPEMNVTLGEMTSNEMMLPWFGVVVDRDAKPVSAVYEGVNELAEASASANFFWMRL